MYLLDDVLAGLDARVAAHVLQRCVLGALRHTARVLVAHAPRHLARAHRVLLLRNGRLVAQGQYYLRHAHSKLNRYLVTFKAEISHTVLEK